MPAMERLGFGPDDEVEVVAEEAPGEELPAEAENDVIEKIQEQLTVCDVEKDAAACVPGHRDHVNVALGPDAGGVRHRGATVARRRLPHIRGRSPERDGCVPLWTTRCKDGPKGVSLRETPSLVRASVSAPRAPPRAGR